jgi:hypothetical protein
MPVLPLRRFAAVLTVVAATLCLVTPRALPAQGAPRGDLLVLLSGSDTIAAERVTRTRARLDGELLIKPANARFTLRVDVDAQGGATLLVNDYRPATADV